MDINSQLYWKIIKSYPYDKFQIGEIISIPLSVNTNLCFSVYHISGDGTVYLSPITFDGLNPIIFR